MLEGKRGRAATTTTTTNNTHNDQPTVNVQKQTTNNEQETQNTKHKRRATKKTKENKLGIVQNYFAGGPPKRRPIAIPQIPIAEQRWSSLLFLFRFTLSSLKRWPSSIHTWKLERSDIARMGRASLVKLVQSPSNRHPIAVQSRNSAAVLQLAACGLQLAACSIQQKPVSKKI